MQSVINMFDIARSATKLITGNLNLLRDFAGDQSRLFAIEALSISLDYRGCPFDDPVSNLTTC